MYGSASSRVARTPNKYIYKWRLFLSNIARDTWARRFLLYAEVICTNLYPFSPTLAPRRLLLMHRDLYSASSGEF